MKRITSSLMAELSLEFGRSAAGGASILSSVKWALRFFLMRNASDFSPQGSTLVTEPPSEAISVLQLLRQAFDLLGGHVLARQIDMLVKSHVFKPFPCLLRSRAEPSEPSERLEDVDVRRREHGKTGAWPCRA